jgi:hypothetical protein
VTTIEAKPTISMRRNTKTPHFCHSPMNNELLKLSLLKWRTLWNKRIPNLCLRSTRRKLSFREERGRNRKSIKLLLLSRKPQCPKAWYFCLQLHLWLSLNFHGRKKNSLIIENFE